MKKYIDNLKQKTKPEKDRIAFISALSITLVIALFWVLSLSVNLKNETIMNEDQKANISEPIQQLKNDFSNVLKSI